MTVTLHQFPYSHFNEKARWALDLKAVDHVRIGHLPGPHGLGIKKISGQPQTPVLDWHGDIIAGSTDIILRINQEVPSPPLLPEEPALRQEVLSYCKTLDESLGPATRSLIFSGLVDAPGYTADMFSRGKPGLTRFIYRRMIPLVLPIIRKANGVNAENLLKAREITHQTMEDIIGKSAATGYLFGDTFTIADLTAAALLAPIASVSHTDMKRPQPVPDAVQKIIDEFRGHPAIEWVKAVYDKHRPLRDS